MTIRKDIHNSDIPIVCQSCEARHQGICGALSPEQLLYLSKHTTKSTHPPETELRAAMETEKSYANILSGVVKLSKLMSDGRQQIVGLQFAPDFMGSPYSKQSNTAIEAATDVRLCSFPRDVLEKMLKEAPEMEHALHEQTLSELNEARDWLLTLGRKKASEKVASFILLIATHIDPERQKNEPIILKLPLKRAAIADYLGLTTETVSRQLTNLRKRNIIEIEDRSTIIIHNIAALKSAAKV
ncbi:MAG: Crp/Fnr family transcriptional regulator [Bacteroidales bacterium]|nr:Crp/Fnr family transcriptional regulator [Bacteroidales bacterium]